MVRAALKEATELQRKSQIPDSDRTSRRDDVADWIEANIVNGDGNWQEWTISDIAEEVDRSRQHVATTLDNYFDPTGQSSQSPLGSLSEMAVDENSGQGYQTGFEDGFEAGVRFALERSDLLEQLVDE